MKKKNHSNNKREVLIKIVTVVSMLIVIFIVYKFIDSLKSMTSVSEHEFYQYFMGQKIEYKGNVKIRNKSDITELITNDGTVNLESIPIYYKDEPNKLILPKDMAIVFPMENGRINRINSLSTIFIDNKGDVYIQKGSIKKLLKDTFIFDGDSLYLFVENTIVKIDDKEYKLPPLSYINVTYKGYVEIYNYDNQEFTYIEEVKKDVIAETNKYIINLSNDSMKYEGIEQLLLKRIKNLSALQ